MRLVPRTLLGRTASVLVLALIAIQIVNLVAFRLYQSGPTALQLAVLAGTQHAQKRLLHDIVEATDVTVADIAQEFGSEIAGIVDGLTKIASLPLSSNPTR